MERACRVGSRLPPRGAEARAGARLAAERTNRFNDELAHALSHKLRNPLNTIRLWIQVLREQAAEPAVVDARPRWARACDASAVPSDRYAAGHFARRAGAHAAGSRAGGSGQRHSRRGRRHAVDRAGEASEHRARPRRAGGRRLRRRGAPRAGDVASARERHPLHAAQWPGRGGASPLRRPGGDHRRRHRPGHRARAVAARLRSRAATARAAARGGRRAWARARARPAHRGSARRRRSARRARGRAAAPPSRSSCPCRGPAFPR